MRTGEREGGRVVLAREKGREREKKKRGIGRG